MVEGDRKIIPGIARNISSQACPMPQVVVIPGESPIGWRKGVSFGWRGQAKPDLGSHRQIGKQSEFILEPRHQDIDLKLMLLQMHGSKPAFCPLGITLQGKKHDCDKKPASGHSAILIDRKV